MQRVTEHINDLSQRDNNVLRKLAEYSDWFVPVNENSHAMLWTVDGVCHWAAQSEKSVPAEGDFRWLEMRGRHLLSVLPDEAQRLVFDWGKDSGFIVDGSALERLRNIAAALDCEEALNTPGLNNGVDAMLSHQWLILSDDEKFLVKTHKGLNSVCAFTAVDALQNYCEHEPETRELNVRSVTGRELFADLDNRDDWDCLWVNPHRTPEWEPLAPGQIFDLTQHREPRPEGRILKARSIAEIHRFLDQYSIPEEKRSHSMLYVGDEMVANYTGEFAGETYSFNFHPVTESGSDLNWGSGATEILCTGRLADVLRRRVEFIEELPTPLSESDSRYVQVAILWAQELIKTLGDQDELSRHTQRTADGARFVREFPVIKTRQFMEHAIALCESVLAIA